MSKVKSFINRDISWLSFNERVLQEAADHRNPLLERIRFLGIFSNNRDEFFRVRFANLRRVVELGKSVTNYPGGKPKQVLSELQRIVIKQQEWFWQIFDSINKEMRSENIYFVDETELNEEQSETVRQYFLEKVRSVLVPVMVDQAKEFPYLRDKTTYLAVKMWYKEVHLKPKFAFIEIPTESLPRFFVLPSKGKKQYVMMLDDVIRHCFKELFFQFEYDFISGHAFKITRDAQLDFEDDISKSHLEKISESIKNRKWGEPVRFVYDKNMPKDLFDFMSNQLEVEENEASIPSGRYHNFKDFMKFPNLGGSKFENKKMVPVKHPDLDDYQSVLGIVSKKDILLHFPYQSFDHFIDMLREAAIDPNVTSIEMTLYRVASQSKIINALINAAKNGKQVTVALELQARFDEKNNIYWSDILEESGINVIFGVPSLKVHSKLCLITSKIDNKEVGHAFIGTGNFNESTAKIYTDHALLTSNPKLIREVRKLFDFLDHNFKTYNHKELIVSPIHTRKRFIRMINKEIANAKAGKPAWLFFKMNSLSDLELIKKLYQASKAGVKIKLIIRGICCLKPGVEGLSENIEVRSIVDKFLEHSRIFVFANNDEPKYYIGSADLMTRNIDRRVEVICPIYELHLQEQLQEMLDIQWRDNQKSRIVNEAQDNVYNSEGEEKIRAQVDFYNYIKTLKPLKA